MISLTHSELMFMFETLSLSAEQKKQLDLATSNLKIEISDELADSLRDSCTARLDTHGFDQEYQPTEEGKKLEELIDKLFIG